MRALVISIIIACLIAACSPQAEEPQMTDWPEIREVWDFGDPAASETQFRDLAAQAEVAGDEVFHAEAMTQVARTFSLLRQFEDANAVLDQVEAGPAADHPRVQVRVLLERGRTLNSGGDASAALALFEEAVPIALEADEYFLAGDAIHMAGIAADTEGEEHWMQVLEDNIARVPDDGLLYWRGPMHNNLGWTYFFADRFADAVEEFRASGSAYAAQDGKRMEALLAGYGEGRSLRNLERCSDALTILMASYSAIQEEFQLQDEYLAEEIALCHAALGDEEAAQPWAQLSYDAFVAQDWFVESESARLEVLRVLAGR